MDEYPKMLYRAQVREKRFDGTPDGRLMVMHKSDQKFSESCIRVVKSAQDQADAEAEGWFASADEALKSASN